MKNIDVITRQFRDFEDAEKCAEVHNTKVHYGISGLGELIYYVEWTVILD